MRAQTHAELGRAARRIFDAGFRGDTAALIGYSRTARLWWEWR